MRVFGNIRDAEVLNGSIDEDLYKAIQFNCSHLQYYYGENRDIYNDDGGIVLYVEKAEDKKSLARFVNLDSTAPEYGYPVKGFSRYLELIYIGDRDFATIVFLPRSMADWKIYNKLEF